MHIPNPAKAAPSPIVLSGSYVRLEPISQAHAADLYAASTDHDDRYRWLFEYPPKSQADIEQWIDSVSDRDDLLMYAVIDKATGRCEGRQACSV